MASKKVTREGMKFFRELSSVCGQDRGKNKLALHLRGRGLKEGGRDARHDGGYIKEWQRRGIIYFYFVEGGRPGERSLLTAQR